MMAPIVPCLFDFNLFCDRGQQGGVLKPTKNDHFQVLLMPNVFNLLCDLSPQAGVLKLTKHAQF